MSGKTSDRRRGLSKLAFVWQASCRVKNEHNVSRLKQFSNLVIIYICRQLGPTLYYEVGFWRPEWTLSRQFGFMNHSRYKKRVAQLNPVQYQKLSQHKLAEKAILQLLAIPTPEYLGFFHSEKGACDIGESLIDADSLQRFLMNLVGETVCFKPVEGYGGTGFVAARVVADSEGVGLHRLDCSEPESIEKFTDNHLKHPDGFVIERYLEQHKDMLEINASSVNTLRIWVRQIKGDVVVLGVLLRIGRAGAMVDNSGQGGLIANVDLESGMLERCRTTDVFPVYYNEHPDSGAPIKGRKLPHWSACLALAKRALLNFPMAGFAGLDMAIGKDGPQIIELNLWPDRVSARVFGKSHKEMLG
ncbi:MAG: hypothetical protein KDI24_11565 [Pseudomonadales bacterium]|nr:hypothetical protein [Pseudomonadales bacterium]MCP5171595.1 hypothetical protein [Pseudomonadales bacterium]